jgi:hypothetical protein
MISGNIMVYGIDYLGGARYSSLVINEHPDGWAARGFANTFGDFLPTARALLRTGRCPRLGVHAVWQDNHTYVPARDDKVIFSEFAKYKKLKKEFSNLEIQFSPFCEHQIKGQQLITLFNRLRNENEGLVLVNSNWRGDWVANEINEVHGSKSPVPNGMYNFSYDGQSCFDSNVEADKQKFAGANTFYLWGPSCNGRLNTNDKTPRPQRKAWLYTKELDSMIYLHRPRQSNQYLPKNWIWKSHADRHTTPPESRAGKPVLISPLKVSRFTLCATNGQIICQLDYFGPFERTRHRYYSPEWGFESAEKARRITGSPECVLVEFPKGGGIKEHGRLNPAHRANDFRLV